jgi:hypothetical protein
MLTYTHGAPPLPQSERCDRTPRYGNSYEEMVRRCYWDYVRVYVPGGATLIASEGLDRMVVEQGESDTTVFAGVLTLRPGDTQTVRFTYWLPGTVAALPYELTVRKQAGAPPWPVRVSTGRCQWEERLVTDLSFTCPTGVE